MQAFTLAMRYMLLNCTYLHVNQRIITSQWLNKNNTIDIMIHTLLSIKIGEERSLGCSWRGHTILLGS